MENDRALYLSALNDFRQARRKAKLQSLTAVISGKHEKLLSYDEVKRHIKVYGLRRQYLAEIPLDSIVGSVGRYLDFNKKFLPLTDSDAERWARVKLTQEQKGLPPIEVYKIGEIYFVIDGNHRVSIAKQMKIATIEAYVSEFRTNLEIKPDDNLEDLILKTERAELFDEMGLERFSPDFDIKVTEPGGYKELFEHISVHHYYLGLEQRRDIPIEKAVNSWVKNVYRPVIRTIRQLGILRDFPSRTETDLYLWLKKHQVELAGVLDWNVDVNQAAKDLTQRFNRTPGRVLAEVWGRIIDLATPDELETGPPPGEWRVNVSLPRQDKLFNAILVGLSGKESNWQVLDEAILVARHEGSVLRGLHVATNQQKSGSQKVKDIRDRFYTRCSEEKIKGEFAVEVGQVARQIVQRAIWTDLVMIHLNHPPGTQPQERLQSGIRTILQRCSRPVLAIPSVTTRLDVTLLAYDGSPKAEEALFLSSYLGSYWDSQLVVVSSTEGQKKQNQNLTRARDYLQNNGVKAEYVEVDGPAGDAILEVAHAQRVNLIVMGGFGKSPLINVAVGSTVDQMLREFGKPILICR
jgi:nucleotide-binding universal stress UspA family protein